MKLEHIHESVPITVTIGIGLGLALGCGYMIGNQESKTVGLILGAIMVMALLLFARQNIWMIIPACWGLSGKVVALPLPFTVYQLSILLTFGMFLVLKALKVVRLKPKMGIEEGWMLVVLGYLLTVFLRNPVGVEALGSDRVGGKPYADVIIGCLGYWVLARASVTAWQARFVPLLGVIGSGINGALNYLAFRFPSVVGPLASVYSGIAAAENEANPLAEFQTEGGRYYYLQNLGMSLTGAACSYWRPFTLINPVYFRRFAMFMIGVTAILLAGFRSALMRVFEVFVLASYFRRGIREVMRAAAPGLGVLVALLLLQGRVISLPFAAQRALSFLPGNWDDDAKLQAEGSTQWRVEMWKAMLTEDKYIHNKWLGDGFGFTHQQLEIMAAVDMSGSNADQQENLMISGGVHSGPVSSIRYVGYVGLALFLIYLVSLARFSVRLIRRAQGTPFFPMALAVGVPTIVFPANFVFIFGSYSDDLPGAIMILGTLKLLSNSLDAYEAGIKKSAPEIIQPPKHRPMPRFAPAGNVT